MELFQKKSLLHHYIIAKKKFHHFFFKAFKIPEKPTQISQMKFHEYIILPEIKRKASVSKTSYER